VEQAANAIIEGGTTIKQAAEDFGVSKGAISHRLRIIRGPVAPPKKRPHKAEEPEIEVIRVEDLE